MTRDADNRTTELREKLTERGVKWWPMRNNGYYEDRDTEFVANGKKHTAHEWGDGLAVYNLTPEQAVAATLVSGTSSSEAANPQVRCTDSKRNAPGQSMEGSKTLLPCPFCGGWAEYGVTMAGEEVYCIRCGAAMPRQTSRSAAERAWNTRTASGDGFSRAVHDGHLWRRCDACEGGAVPMTDEAMAAHGWVRERTCEMETDWDYLSDGVPCAPEDTWAYMCSACEWSFRYDRGIKPNYCPNCGAKVVQR